MKHLSKKLLFLLIAAFSTSGLFAQSDSLPQVSIVLIPFPPEYYLSDADRDICAASNLEPVQLQHDLRVILDRKLAAALETLGSCATPCSDSSKTSRLLLGRFYDRTAYSYQEAVGRRILAKQKGRENTSKRQPKAGGDRPSAEMDATQALANRGDGKYMSAEPRDTSLLAAIRSTYGGNWIVSINQLDIRTNYNSCIDIINGVYTREVLVHYSLFDPRGKEVRGDFALATFPSNDNRIGNITDRCFVQIANEIRSNVAAAVR